ncbi:hypothetical protein VOLCADRAFT_100069 [Volvox carteri f. nagariensis]|uniref:Uncharacterized protein n=1 Tax=Volvox carteri f. nagariensis TaxID=3068 RepID=D8UJC4_VOLCA|nr:uncharacterized protein VOLCADRAFT_100069 [Volvox carteri f. nagariensis]EFJ40164.1 hypothetical protein VOLCADRAFT_100069 [Volvox carteri f. nagariensis]|eukprot:XP_002958774.1 hypothetical protein VOLCADRAFT_100069 [Volvox carteri f. nagariensis]
MRQTIYCFEQVCQSGISAPVAGHLSGLYQLLEAPRSELSVQAQLNDRLKHCNTWEELAALLEANIDIVDFVNVSTAWTRLAKLFESTGPHKRDGLSASGAAPVREPAFRRFLARLIDTTSQQLRLFGVQALANVMWALSNADWQLEQYEPAVDKLMHEWCASVHNRLPELRAPDVSNISTSIGRLDHRWRPEFIVEFYRSVLHRADLLEQLDLTTLNNLLYGLSRAGCRGLIHMGPASRRLLAQCVDRILERPDREAVGLVPWRAAQLLYNCHKFKLRVRSHLYGVLMPVVAEVYTCEPNPMDCWSMGFLTAFVAAHRRVHPTARPDLRPLYAYMERRLPEASTSQLAMLAHAFRELGCPAPASFWGQVFSRYMGEPLIHSVPVPAPVPPHPAAVSSGLVQQQQQQPPQQQQLPQQRAAEQLIQQRQRPPHASQLLGLQPQQRMTAESADGRILTAEQLHSSQGLQHGGEPPAKTQAQVLSTDQTALAVAGPAAFQPPRLVNSSMAVAATVSLPMHPDDDLAEPRTLHYVCWQAAKAGILPPRAFLRLYVERVPQWLVHSADDTQVAQAVETLKLLRWVPRRELRDMLCATLKRRAATSRLPMRSLLRQAASAAVARVGLWPYVRI